MRSSFITGCLLVVMLNSCRQTTLVTKSPTDPEFAKLEKLPDSQLTHIDYWPAAFVVDTIRKGTLIQGTFFLKNTGKKNLAIAKVASLCDCTIPDYEKKAVSPDEILPIHFSLDTDDFKKGYNSRFINVYGNFFPYFRNLKIEVYVKE